MVVGRRPNDQAARYMATRSDGDVSKSAATWSTPTWFLHTAALLAAVALGVIALYSSGVGLIDPKLHRAGGFALALIVAVSVASFQAIKLLSLQIFPL